jgi:tetratricopeptide (TPR) repeat protein
MGLLVLGLGGWLNATPTWADGAGIGHFLPSEVEQVLIRGMERGIEGDYRGAILDFSEVIRAYPGLPDGYFNRGLAYQKQGNLTRAIADYSQTLLLDPRYAEAHLARGRIYAMVGDRESALVELHFAAALFRQQGNLEGYRQAIEAIAQLD